VKLLLDEMYAATIAEQLRNRGLDVASIHDPEYRWLERASDADVYAAALRDGRAILTENVPDFRRLEAEALARDEPGPALIFTTNHRFPRGDAATIGRLVVAPEAYLQNEPEPTGAVFLKPADA
jgi:predicted nuclease of predicted toxin-antitoxin system